MARSITLNIVVGDPDVDNTETCPDCQFDSLLAFPLWAISERGVSSWGATKVCGRCYDERNGR